MVHVIDSPLFFSHHPECFCWRKIDMKKDTTNTSANKINERRSREKRENHHLHYHIITRQMSPGLLKINFKFKKSIFSIAQFFSLFPNLRESFSIALVGFTCLIMIGFIWSIHCTQRLSALWNNYITLCITWSELVLKSMVWFLHSIIDSRKMARWIDLLFYVLFLASLSDFSKFGKWRLTGLSQRYVLLILGAIGDTSADVNEHLEKGKRLLAAGQLADALTHFHAAIGMKYRRFRSFILVFDRCWPDELHCLFPTSSRVFGHGKIQSSTTRFE